MKNPLNVPILVMLIFAGLTSAVFSEIIVFKIAIVIAILHILGSTCYKRGVEKGQTEVARAIMQSGFTQSVSILLDKHLYKNTSERDIKLTAQIAINYLENISDDPAFDVFRLKLQLAQIHNLPDEEKPSYSNPNTLDDWDIVNPDESLEDVSHAFHDSNCECTNCQLERETMAFIECTGKPFCHCPTCKKITNDHEAFRNRVADIIETNKQDSVFSKFTETNHPDYLGLSLSEATARINQVHPHNEDLNPDPITLLALKVDKLSDQIANMGRKEYSAYSPMMEVTRFIREERDQLQYEIATLQQKLVNMELSNSEELKNTAIL